MAGAHRYCVRRDLTYIVNKSIARMKHNTPMLLMAYWRSGNKFYSALGLILYHDSQGLQIRNF